MVKGPCVSEGEVIIAEVTPQKQSDGYYPVIKIQDPPNF